jgi:hypothetical protein
MVNTMVMVGSGSRVWWRKCDSKAQLDLKVTVRLEHNKNINLVEYFEAQFYCSFNYNK